MRETDRHFAGSHIFKVLPVSFFFFMIWVETLVVNHLSGISFAANFCKVFISLKSLSQMKL